MWIVKFLQRMGHLIKEKVTENFICLNDKVTNNMG